MDDDPEPNLEQVILESSRKNEQVISTEEFQKFNPESSEDANTDMTQHQESGDTGPFLEQEVLKKPIPSKVVQEPVPEKQRTKSKDRRDSSLRRQERVEQSQGPDASGSVKTPSTPPRKPPRRSLQRLSGQESRRGSQQSVGQPPLSPKHSRSPSRKEAGIIENAWTSERTSKVVKSRTLQKSRVWDPKKPSEAVGSSSEDLEKTDNTNTEEEFSTVWDTTETDEEVFRKLSVKKTEFEEILWMSQKPIRTMKSQTQQTSFIWDQNPVSEILGSSSQESQNSQETEYIELSEGTVTSFGEPDNLQSAAPPNDEKPKKKCMPKAEDSQQTDSANSFKKTLLDHSQQTDPVDDMNFHSEVALKLHYGSQEHVELKSHVGNLKSVSQHSLKAKLRNGGQKEPENEPIEPEEKAALAKGAREEAVLGNMWISRKTGKVVRNQIQQTDRSWLQYLVTKMRKVKRCRSQQTDESFLQRYSTIKMKRDMVGDLSKSVDTEPYQHDGPSSCESDMETSDLKFVEFEVTSLGDELAKSAPDQEVLTSEGEVQQPEDDQGKVKPSDIPERWSEEPGSQTTLDDDISYIEGFDAFQQTYSIISLEDGIWMNRRTGKLLISHSQQTSITSLPGSKTSLAKVIDEEVDGCFKLTVTRADESLENMKQVKRRTEPEAELPPSQASDQGRDRESHVILVKPVGPDQISEDVEVQMSRHLSEAMLLSTDSAFTELAPVDIYSTISFQDGIFLNTKTGRQLSSQTQQTEEPFETIFKDCLKITKVPSLTTRLSSWIEPPAAELKAAEHPAGEQPVEVKAQPSSDARKISESKKNSVASSDSRIIPKSRKKSEPSSDSRIIQEPKKNSEPSSDTPQIPESRKNSEPSSDSKIIPESKKNSEISSDSRIIPESRKNSEPSSDTPQIPETKKNSEPSSDSRIIPESRKNSEPISDTPKISESRKTSEPSGDTPKIPESRKTSEPSIDTSKIPESGKESEPSIDTPEIPESRKESEPSSDTNTIPESGKESETSSDTPKISESRKNSEPSSDTPKISESRKNSEPSSDTPKIPESRKESEPSSDTSKIPESRKKSEPSSDTPKIPESGKESEPSSDTPQIPESRKSSEQISDTPNIPESRKSSEQISDTPKIPESRKSSEQISDTPKIPEPRKNSEPSGDTPKIPESRKSSEHISDIPKIPESRKRSEQISDTPKIPESRKSSEHISDVAKIPESRKNSEPSGDTPKIQESKKNLESSGDTSQIPESRKNSEPSGDTPKIPESTKSSEQISDLLKIPESRKHSESISEPPKIPGSVKKSESSGDTPRIPEISEPISDVRKIPESRKNIEPSGDSPQIPESKKDSEPSSEPPPIPERTRKAEPNREDAEPCPPEGMDDDPSSKNLLETEEALELPESRERSQESSLEPPEEEEQAQLSEPSSESLQPCAEEGMDDDPSRRHRPMRESSMGR